MAVAHLLRQTEAEHVIVGQEPVMQEMFAAAVELLKQQGARVPTSSPMLKFEDLYPKEAEPNLQLLPPMVMDDKIVDATILHSSGTTPDIRTFCTCFDA